MNIIVTCGPSYEPIDQVRRITNFSTGRLGITIANALTDCGHRVFCLKGEQATDPTPSRAFKTILFSTNDDLASKIRELRTESIGAIFHAAALCDFKVASVEEASGKTIHSAKIPTRGHDSLHLTLAPTAKVLPQLRDWFAAAKIIGWKYELVGSREEAIAKGFQQIRDCRTDACVVNGAAYGAGFGICVGKTLTEAANLQALIDELKKLVP